jgi:hypothetical protein
VRAAYVIGAPGVGKTTALELAFPAVAPAERAPGPFGLLWLTPIAGGWRLGRPRARFSGTDALAMNVHPQAVAWALAAPMPEVVVGEGQRLATAAFLDALRSRGTVRLIHLTADPLELERRRAGRGQNETWVRAATTRAANLAAELGAATIDTTGLSPDLVAEVLRSLVE